MHICLTKLEFIPGRSFSSNEQRTKFSVSSLNKINWGHIIHQLTFITPSVKVFRSILSQAMKGKKYFYYQGVIEHLWCSAPDPSLAAV